MNRTIKFRGKRIDNGKWIYANLRGLGIGMFNECVNEDTIGQFTGLFDKNGKEIYEGDIIEWLFLSYGYYGEQENYLKGYIEWYQGGLVFNVTENDFENAVFYAISDLHTYTESDVKILGNIYDNPDLIKEENK